MYAKEEEQFSTEGVERDESRVDEDILSNYGDSLQS